MSEDARNSVYAWAAVTVFVVLFASMLKFDLFADVPQWVANVGGILAIVNLVWLGYQLWSKRDRGQQETING